MTAQVMLLAGLATLMLPAYAATPAPTKTGVSHQDVSRRLAAYMKARRDLGHFNGTVMVVQDGRTLIGEGEGWAEFEHRIPASLSTRYAVASITKQFTAAAILQLRDRGLLSLDDALCRHISPCPESWAPIRIRHLLNHTSGVLDYEEKRGLGKPQYIAFVTLPDHIETAIKEAAEAPLEFAPGSKFHYSNTGYILLSRIVSKVSGQPYADYVEKNVLRLAGMNDSRIFRREIIANMAHGYRIKKLSLILVAEGQNLADPTLVEPRVLGDMSGDHGDASLITTAPDLAKWVTALMGGKIVSPASLREMTTPVRDGYGFGLQTGERFGTKRISHAGGLAGFESWLDYYPDKKTIVITLSNFERTRIDEVERDLAAIALGQPYAVPSRRRIIELPDSSINKWAGEYALPKGVATVRVDKGFLEFRSPDGAAGTLLPLSPTRFYLPRLDSDAVEGIVEFLPGSASAKTQVRIHYRDTLLRGEKR